MTDRRVVVELHGFDAGGAPAVIAHAWLDSAGHAACDAADLLLQWQQDGVLGRSSRGRLYPVDGRAFLCELPHVYRNAYLRAVVVEVRETDFQSS